MRVQEPYAFDTGVTLSLAFSAAMARAHDLSASPDDITPVHRALNGLFGFTLAALISVPRVASRDNLKVSLVGDMKFGSQSKFLTAKNDELLFGFAVALLGEFGDVQQ
jgi:hypothetical protein